MMPPDDPRLPQSVLRVAPPWARLLHRMQQLRNQGRALAVVDLATLTVRPLSEREKVALEREPMYTEH